MQKVNIPCDICIGMAGFGKGYRGHQGFIEEGRIIVLYRSGGEPGIIPESYSMPITRIPSNVINEGFRTRRDTFPEVGDQTRSLAVEMRCTIALEVVSGYEDRPWAKGSGK